MDRDDGHFEGAVDFGLDGGGRGRLAKQPAPDPADELKRKLAESRSEEEPASAAEPEADQPAAELDERRREVHERARASIEQMRGQPPEG